MDIGKNEYFIYCIKIFTVLPKCQNLQELSTALLRFVERETLLVFGRLLENSQRKTTNICRNTLFIFLIRLMEALYFISYIPLAFREVVIYRKKENETLQISPFPSLIPKY